MVCFTALTVYFTFADPDREEGLPAGLFNRGRLAFPHSPFYKYAACKVNGFNQCDYIYKKKGIKLNIENININHVDTFKCITEKKTKKRAC